MKKSNKKYRINSKLRRELLAKGFSKEQIKEMFCRTCGKFGFECIWPMTSKDLENEKLISAQNLF